MLFIFTTTWKKWTPIFLEADIKKFHATEGEIKTKWDTRTSVFDLY